MLDVDVVSLPAIISQIYLSCINYNLISLHTSSFTGEQWYHGLHKNTKIQTLGFDS